MTRHWWIIADGTWFECQSDNFVECAFEHPGYFGLTETDRQFMLSTSGRSKEDQVAAFLEKALNAHNPIDPKTSGAGAILAEWEDAGARFILAFSESHDAYLRVMKWLIGIKADLGKKVVIKDWATQRTWDTTVEQILRGGQFSKNPDTHVTCNRCGQNIDRGEVVDRRICPKCGMPLV